MNGEIRITTAGAGSGKTTELTRLMHEQIASGAVRPQAIIAATFTVAAAAELAERVRRELFAGRLLAEAKRLEESLVGTVHGICFRLLERFAFEAGISPRLEILDEAVGNAVISEAIEEVCTLEDVERMERLAVRLNQRDQQSKESRWKGQVKELISRAMENGINPPELGRMAQLSVADLFDLLPVAATGDLNRALRDAIGHAETEIAAGTDTTDKTLKALEQAREARRNIEQGDLPWSKWYALARSTPGKKSEAAFGPLKSVAARVEEHPQLREELEAYTRGLFDIAARSLQSYRQHKEERGQLDFTDLEARVVHLLDHPLVQEVIREEYDLLLVDEFQDTSPLQLALFLKLANLVRGQSIWVGDTKQAIYGFRGSDPELMNSVVATVRNRGGVNPPLDQSYRTRKELCDWFNKLFAPAFEETHGIKSVEVALNTVRADLDGFPAPLDVWVSSSGLFNKGDGKPKSLTNDQATDVIADGVQTLLGESIQVSDRNSGGLRPLKMRDIVLLCRTNAHADRIADALARRGIPVSREGGGLMKTPEAVFSLACLKRLVDPEDTLASATIIALDGAKEPEQWLQDRLEWIEPGSNEQGRWGIDGALRHPALVALDEARERVASASPAEALDEALALANAFGTASAWGPTVARAAQRRANLESLRGLAAQYESLCASSHAPATVAGFLLWARALEAAPIAVDRGADAVQIFTYHGAKGLEWPVVICTQLDTDLRPRVWDQALTVEEEAFDPLNPLKGRRLRFWAWPFGASGQDGTLGVNAAHSAIGKQAAADAMREELRLLYVGFTRVRDLLILESRERSDPIWPQHALGADFSMALGSILSAPRDGEMPFLGARARRKTLIAREVSSPSHDAAAGLAWFPPPTQAMRRPLAFLRPSDTQALPNASIGRQVDLGCRLPVRGKCDEVNLGSALHSIFAPILLKTGGRAGGDEAIAEQIIDAFGLSGCVSGTEVLSATARLLAVLNDQFAPLQLLVEIPFEHALEDGTRVMGFIDLALETAGGWVIIDHKSFQGGAAQCDLKALEYSGQLARYREALVAAGREVRSQWIHFPVGGRLVEILFP